MIAQWLMYIYMFLACGPQRSWVWINPPLVLFDLLNDFYINFIHISNVAYLFACLTYTCRPLIFCAIFYNSISFSAEFKSILNCIVQTSIEFHVTFNLYKNKDVYTTYVQGHFVKLMFLFFFSLLCYIITWVICNSLK